MGKHYSVNLLYLECVLVQLLGGGLGEHNVLIFFIEDVCCVESCSSRSLETWIHECSSEPCGFFYFIFLFSQNCID